MSAQKTQLIGPLFRLILRHCKSCFGECKHVFRNFLLQCYHFSPVDNKGKVRSDINNTDTEFPLTKFYYKTADESETQVFLIIFGLFR